MDRELAEGGEFRGTSLRLINDYNRGHYVRNLYRLLIQCVLFLYTFDPYGIYKKLAINNKHGRPPNPSSRFKLYLASPLRMELGPIDGWRSRWRPIIRLIISYICLKFSAIVVVQTALTTGKRQQQQQQPRLLEQLLGNPLNGLPGTTIFIYSFIVASLSYVVLYLSHYYQHHTLDWVNIRLWLDPTREFKRIDLSILHTLDNYAKPFRPTCHCHLAFKAEQFSAQASQYQLMGCWRVQTQIIGSLKHRHWCLRPTIYTFDSYRAFDRFVINISVPVVLALVAFSVQAVRQLLSFTLANHSQVTPANWQNQLVVGWTFFRTLTIVETTLSLVLVLPISLLLIIVFLCSCFTQLLLLQDMRHHLLVCLANMKRMQGDNIVQSDHLHSIGIMLKSLIKINLSLEELRSNAKFLTEMVSVNMVISSTTCVSILLAANLDGQDLHQFRIFIIVCHWLWANWTLTGCAYIYKSAMKLEKITWSMMAEMRWRESRHDWLMYELQVADYWRRLILSRSFSDPRLSVRPFGITLTYYRQLQLNFLALSFAVVLRTF